mgnify:CR=1 FL=1
MTENEYQELIAFIGEKFEQVDRRLDQMATKEEVQETRRHMGVLVEAVRDDVRQVAEGLAGTNQRLDGPGMASVRHSPVDRSSIRKPSSNTSIARTSSSWPWTTRGAGIVITTSLPSCCRRNCAAGIRSE